MKLYNDTDFIKFMAFFGYFLWIITYLLRSIALNISGIVDLIVGVLPNFGVALSFPYLAAFLCETAKHGKYRVYRDKMFYISIVLGFILLFIIELWHDIFMNSPFDINDLVASILAFTTAGVIYLLIKDF